jgi:putative DNA primase/helicase
MKLREHARGKWELIISEIVGEQYINTRKHGPCPCGEGKDRYRFSNGAGTGTYFCACSQGDKDGFDLIQCAKGWTFAETAEAIEKVIGKPAEQDPIPPKSRAERIWERAEKSRVSHYLANRGLEVPPTLRWERALPYFDTEGRKTGTYPAMIAPVVREGRLQTVHVTYIENGVKAPVDPAKKLLGAATGGSACPLYPMHGSKLGIAEGVETAIAAKMLFGVPTWAALNTSLLKNFRPPPTVEHLVIFADNDENLAGHAAAYHLAHSLIKQGLKVTIKMPDEPGDWNDVLLQNTIQPGSLSALVLAAVDAMGGV